MNDRALRNIVIGLEARVMAHENGFDITVASEIMAIALRLILRIS